MNLTILTLEIRYEQDVVLTRQKARKIAELLGFDSQIQVRIATAVSEIARNTFQYAGRGIVEFKVEGEAPQNLVVGINDNGPGIPNLKTILEGRYTSTSGMGWGIINTQKLVDQFQIESVVGQGTKVLISKKLPKKAPNLTNQRLEQIKQELDERSPQNPFEEIQRQNQELLQAMAELRKREEELMHLNRELEDTNRGVVALYAELDEKADSLQKANELKTRFFSNMSHEFRTPLNSVISLSRILLARMDGPLTAEQEKQVTFIQKAAGGLLELINDLLDMAKVEAGKTTVHPSDFEVSDLFGALRGMLRPLLAYNSSVALIFDEAVDLPTLHTDEGKVAQILRNFISNALKYTQQGEVRVKATVNDRIITFSVADTGIGIAPSDRERIFEDFVQIESELQKRVKGTGLGLPLSKKLAQLLGGDVSFQSELGQGSTFFATIPFVYPGYTPATALPLPTWQIDPERYPVLVVEDNDETLLIYEKYLQAANYQTLAAKTVNEAKQALQRFRPVAIILDILLQKQHTWSFLSEIKRNEATRNIPVLVITVIDNEKQVLASGADEFLIKPVDRLLLLAKLDTLVKQEKLQKLLLIDDDLASRYVLKQLLNNTSLDILEAANGTEGLRLAETEKPQAIVLDLNMPGRDGIEVLKQLKHNPITSAIPVIINTSKPLEPEEQNYLAKNSVAILAKQTSSQADASNQLRQALVRAGLILNHN
ncbi:response regulator [Nostocaceae cyanobacterium CENA369]|uniref:histidine kinase n=1 Tax=Dendronalium phyllosphericum CENA369 TaxID=1725256 RepID=A0A8J7I5S2_9NOST|nr:ATP-binding protein [Dendronalium phyllosphericum]MBH8574388.1 response regulator [Dendronalium phyllosphericum CENA369]